MAEEQRLLHIITEILAIPMGFLLIYIGSSIKAKKWKKVALIVMGAGNLIIDGFMITTWF